jgi:seryl-tRNA synthetase
MGIDIVLFRADQGGKPDLVRESQRRRYKSPDVVDQVIAADETHKKSKFPLSRLI